MKSQSKLRSDALRRCWWLVLIALLAPIVSRAQSVQQFNDAVDAEQKRMEDVQVSAVKKPTYNLFLKNFMEKVVMPEVAKARGNQIDPSKEPQTPSISTESTSLIDKSSVPDAISLALNLAGLQTQSGGGSSGDDDTTSSSATVTASALKAYLSGEDPLDPFVYNRDRQWRRLSFTFGKDSPSDQSAADALFRQGTIYGVKLSLIDRRDASHEGNAGSIGQISTILQDKGKAASKARLQIDEYLRSELSLAQTSDKFEQANFLTTLKKLSDPQKQGVIDIMVRNVDGYIAYATGIEKILADIRRKKQLSLSYEGKNRAAGNPDDYRTLLTYDVGYLTTNLSYGREASFASGAFSTKTGLRFGAEYRVPLNSDSQEEKTGGARARRPRMLSFSAVADTAAAPRVYKAQAKLTIPISDGIEIPISLTAANRSEFINEGKIKGRIGFTFDLSKLKVGNILDRAKSGNNTLQATAMPTPTLEPPAPVEPTPDPVATRPLDLRVQVQALDEIYRPARNLTVEVSDGATVVASERTDADGMAYLSIPNYSTDAAHRYTVRIKYFQRVLETVQVAGGQANLAVQIGPDAMH